MGLPVWYRDPSLLEAGVDEAGRGCLAGPVVAAAVILDPSSPVPEALNDSKKLTAPARAALADWIRAHALGYAVSLGGVDEIAVHNILGASLRAMHLAIEGLPRRPDLLLVDGPHFIPYLGVAHECLIRGDGRVASIAAASILAKVHRDELMVSLHHEHPLYNWATNKGYPTADHRRAVLTYGPTPHHRAGFRVTAPRERGV